jgi:hypothetical protein
MSNVPAKIASVLFVTAAIGLGAVAAGLPDYTAKAADGCLKEPEGATPQGKHWYYRIERGTGRKCWYMRDEGDQAARADEAEAPPSAKPAPRRQDLATTRSIADAHAEISTRTRIVDEATPSVWPNPPVAAAAPAAPATAADNDAGNPQVASRWPQTPGAAPADPSTAPAEQAPEASLMVADAQSDTAADPAQQPPPMSVPPVRKTGSIQMLLLVAGSALALAGLSGSAVYRLGRRRKRNDWLRERSNWQSEENSHNPPWVEPAFVQPHTALTDLDEMRDVMPPSNRAEAARETEHTDERVERIEDFLARLTAQLHQEMETRGERDAHASS